MSEKQQQSETCMVIKSKSQGSVATWFRSGGIFYQYFVKISRYLVKLSVSKLIASGTMCSGHCFAERWRTRLRSIAWRAVPAYHITIAALSNLDSMIDKYQTCVFLTTLMCQLIPSLSVWTLIVFASILSWRLYFWLLQLRTVGYSSGVVAIFEHKHFAR